MSDTAPPLGLAQLTALELPPPELLRAAAEGGCAMAGIRMLPASEGGVAYPLMDDPVGLQETLSAIADTGVPVVDLEIARLTPEVRVADFLPFLETGARLGAKHVLVAGYDPDEARLVASFAAFCDAASPFGLTGDLEFMPWSSVPDLAAAIRVVGAAGRPNCGIVLDPLHFDRSGSRIEDVARIPRAWLHYWQMCDAPPPRTRPPTTEELLHTARAERLFPGDGALDLRSLVRAIPPELPISIEIPTVELARTVPAAERVRRAVAATRRLLTEAAPSGRRRSA